MVFVVILSFDLVALVTIPFINVAFAFVPVIVVLIIMFRWSLAVSDSAVALARMLIQLILIGYALNWIFAVDSSLSRASKSFYRKCRPLRSRLS